MLNIVICDDEKGTCEELKDILLNHSSRNQTSYHIETYYTGTDLSEALMNHNRADILFLDIALPGVDGINVGKMIRNTMGDEQTVIVYISSSKSYALELFQNRPFDFLTKPLEEEKITSVMDKILQFLRKTSLFWSFETKGNCIRYPIETSFICRVKKGKSGW